eukprot:COSAG02_NODE_404_length_23022_cov_305.366008_1_plen_86_part_00
MSLCDSLDACGYSDFSRAGKSPIFHAEFRTVIQIASPAMRTCMRTGHAVLNITGTYSQLKCVHTLDNLSVFLSEFSGLLKMHGNQ